MGSVSRLFCICVVDFALNEVFELDQLSVLVIEVLVFEFYVVVSFKVIEVSVQLAVAVLIKAVLAELVCDVLPEFCNAGIFLGFAL